MGAAMSFINSEYDHVALIQRWFDRWLKDEPNGIDEEPPVKVFMSGSNQWRSFPSWPPPSSINVPYYLHSDGALELEPPHDSEPVQEFTYNPADPVPTVGGSVLMHPYYIPGPRNQHLRDGRTDILRFCTCPLERKILVTGPVKVHLWAASSAPDTDFVATLLDVHPDGRAFNLTDGIIRARFRSGPMPEYLTPGHPYEFTIDLWSIGHVFLAGHCIRLDISSSNFPRWDRSRNTGPDSAPDTIRSANQTIYHDAAHRSRLVLPVLPWE